MEQNVGKKEIQEVCYCSQRDIYTHTRALSSNAVQQGSRFSDLILLEAATRRHDLVVASYTFCYSRMGPPRPSVPKS